MANRTQKILFFFFVFGGKGVLRLQSQRLGLNVLVAQSVRATSTSISLRRPPDRSFTRTLGPPLNASSCWLLSTRVEYHVTILCMRSD